MKDVSNLPKIIDFKKDKTSAIKEADKRSKQWKSSLDKDQKDLIDNSSEFQNINKELEQHRGSINIIDTSIKKGVDLIDKALRKKGARLKNKHYIYVNLKEKDMGFKQDSFFDPTNNSIILAQADKIRQEFKYGIIHHYMFGNLSEQQRGPDYPVLIHLEVPTGTNIGYVKEDQIFIDRNQGIMIDDPRNISIITRRGMEILKIQAKLVPKATVENEIKKEENRLNQTITSTTNIRNIKVINFFIDGFYSSSIISRSERLFNELNTVMPNFKKVIANMDPSGAITFKDQRDMKTQDIKKGEYDAVSKSLWIQINHDDHLIDDEDRKTLFRLVGYAYDHLVFKNQSISSKFDMLYNSEKNNVTMDATIQANPTDFFAGVFSYLFTPNSAIKAQIQSEAPQTSSFIEGICRETKNPRELRSYLINYNNVPLNLITKKEARKFGWRGGDLHRFVNNMSIGGDIFHNRNGQLPPGGRWYELDNDYNGGSRGSKRWVYSKDQNNEITFIYETVDHYQSFRMIYRK
ncbi:hypothetical protein CN353_28820 [Bacillus cereus]|nr:hypothetical protein CN353_28820 [Bacillus cereus]